MSETGRTSDHGPFFTGRRPAPPGTVWHVRPDGREVLLVRVPGGPVLDEGARRRCDTFWIEAVPATLGCYAPLLVALHARGEALAPYLPPEPAGSALRAHATSGAPLPLDLAAQRVGHLPPGAAEAWVTWAGLRPLTHLERRRAAAALGVPEDDLRGGTSAP
ncbi:MAG: hypothetical protein M9894_00925 [Planctomycetes bacterium]|nr:hypothetical protein [Planctomycetota bacterium]